MLSGILALIGIIPSALSTVDGITNAISNAKIAAIKAQTDEERIKAQEEVSGLEARRDVLISQASIPGVGKINACMGFLLALGPLLILLKLGFDKAIGPFYGCTNPYVTRLPDYCFMFRTDPVDPNVWWVIGAVVSFYLVATRKLR